VTDLGVVRPELLGAALTPPLRHSRWRPVRWRRIAGRIPTGDALPIASVSAVSALATIATPALLAHPLLLVALTPRIPFLALAAGQSPLAALVAVAVPRLCLCDVFWFRIGRRLGPGALDRLPRRCRRIFERAPRARNGLLATVILVRPIGRHLAAGAAAGLDPLLIAALDIAGTLAFVVAVGVGAQAVLG
jgi:hypothetical protein